MLAVFSAAILLSAALLFTLQPMVAKMLLPMLGGSPSVWNTCMVFFQAGLLLGYAYAHLLASRLAPRAQVAVHAGVLLAPLLVLPVAVRAAAPPGDGQPVLWLLGALATGAGLPFFALSATGPLLQRWFSATGHAEAGDPYFLYAASNLGSLGGLLAYPVLIEPLLPLQAAAASQSALWSAGYVACGAAVVASGWLAARRQAEGRDGTGPATSPPVGWRTRGFWLLLAFAPSSLLLGTTQYLTTDIAAIPFLWIVPLALYLGTFVVAFARRRPAWLVAVAGVALAISAAAAAVLSFPSVLALGALELGLPLLALACAGLVAHGRLADARPAPDRLTEFYLFVALGGVLGGIFNALIAPLLFPDVWEYPAALALACTLRAPWRDDRGGTAPRRELAFDLAAAALVAAIVGVFAWRRAEVESLGPGVAAWLRAGLPGLLVIATMGWRRRFALCFAVLLAGAWIETARTFDTIHQERTFFGVHRVVDYVGPPFKTDEESGLVFRIPFHVLVHGSTRHGTQALDPRYARVPTTYYHPTGPAGQLFETLRPSRASLRVALVGLGAGTLAAYGRTGDRFTVYDIDPAVIRIARDRRYFTYVADSAAEFAWFAGDGRLSIARAPAASFDLIVLDAFSSDAIPVHLLTREAFATYVEKLAPGGLLAVHLSNQYVDLPPVVEASANAAGAQALVRWDPIGDERQLVEGKDASVWAVVAATPESLAPFASDARWRSARRAATTPAWTDDFSDVLRSLEVLGGSR